MALDKRNEKSIIGSIINPTRARPSCRALSFLARIAGQPYNQNVPRRSLPAWGHRLSVSQARQPDLMAARVRLGDRTTSSGSMTQDQNIKVQRERRYQSVMLSVCAAGMLWILQTLVSLSSDIAGIKPRIDALDVQLSLMYRASDARRDIADVSARLGASERRIERIEARLREAHQ